MLPPVVTLIAVMMSRLVSVLFLLLVVLSVNEVLADPPPASDTSGQHADMSVMQSFTAQQAEVGEAVRISDQEKHQWLFIMGVTLLVLLLTTAVLGIAMGVYGKPVFVAHMITAGLSLTLAIAHAIAALVWFNPF